MAEVVWASLRRTTRVETEFDRLESRENEAYGFEVVSLGTLPEDGVALAGGHAASHERYIDYYEYGDGGRGPLFLNFHVDFDAPDGPAESDLVISREVEIYR